MCTLTKCLNHVSLPIPSYILCQAATHFLTLEKDVGEITREDFPLKSFDRHLAGLQKKLIEGVGVEVLRGLPVEHYSQVLSTPVLLMVLCYPSEGPL